MTNGPSREEAPAAGPARQPARWLVLAAVPVLLAFAAARGVHASSSDEPRYAPSPEPLRPQPEPAAARAEPIAQPALPAQPAPPAPSGLTSPEHEPLQSELPPEPPPPQSVVPPELASVLPAPPLPRGAAAPDSTLGASAGTVPAGSLNPLLRPAVPRLGEATGASAGGAPPALEDEECEPTPLTPARLAEVLRDGHIRHFGAPPHADRWACAWAHCAFEQKRGGAIYGNNLGHVTAPLPPGVPPGTRPAGRVCLRRMHERLVKSPDRWALVDLWFRVFDSPEEGAEAYWRLLASSYYSVIARCDAADPRGAAQRLAEIGYFTGPEGPYIEGMARLFVSARGSLIPRVIAASQRPPVLLDAPSDRN